MARKLKNDIPIATRLRIYKDWQSGKYYNKEIYEKYGIYRERLLKIIDEFKDRR